MAATTLWILGAVGSLYLALAASLVYRACKPSCRVCVFWQQCLHDRLGFSAEPGADVPCLKCEEAGTDSPQGRTFKALRRILHHRHSASGGVR